MHKQSYLTSSRLLIRSLRFDDREFVRSLLSDKNVRQFLGGVVPLHKQEKTLTSIYLEEDGSFVWLVEEQVTQEKLGLIYLSKHHEETFLELSYQFAFSAWGNGYATEACRVVLDFALNDLKLERIVAETQANNLASCGLLKRLNMRELRRLQRFGAEQIVFITQ